MSLGVYVSVRLVPCWFVQQDYEVLGVKLRLPRFVGSERFPRQ